MQDLIQQLTSKVDITEDQAKQVLDVIVDTIDDRLPDALAGPVKKALAGNDDAASQLANVAEGAIGKLGGMFGG